MACGLRLHDSSNKVTAFGKNQVIAGGKYRPGERGLHRYTVLCGMGIQCRREIGFDQIDGRRLRACFLRLRGFERRRAKVEWRSQCCSKTGSGGQRLWAIRSR